MHENGTGSKPYIEEHRAAFGGGRECAGSFASRFLSNFSPAFHLGNTVRQWWRDGRTDYGLPTLDRFPQFSAYRSELAYYWRSGDAENSRNRSNLAILPLTDFRGRAPALSATIDKTHLVLRPLAASETPRRATVDAGFGMSRIAQPTYLCHKVSSPSRVYNPRSRVLALSVVARGRGNTRVWLIVAGNRRSATARGWNGKMANFCGLRRFATKFKCNQCQLNVPDAKPRKPQNRRKAKGRDPPASTTVGQCFENEKRARSC